MLLHQYFFCIEAELGFPKKNLVLNSEVKLGFGSFAHVFKDLVIIGTV